MPRLFQGARQDWRYTLKSIALGLLFWAIQLLYQFYVLIPGEIKGSIVRGSALAGATLIGIALLIGPLARLFPRRNYVRHRRTFGVLGFTFIIIHTMAVIAFLFNFDIGGLVFERNPYANPIIFGLLAFYIYIPLYLTSTDWATRKLGFRKWKAIHRLVYIAWILSVLHFVQINPKLLFNPAGYLLLIVTALVFIFEITAFIWHVKAKGGPGKYIGALIIIFGGILFYLAYAIKMSIIVLWGIPVVFIGAIVLYAFASLTRKQRLYSRDRNE